MNTKDLHATTDLFPLGDRWNLARGELDSETGERYKLAHSLNQKTPSWVGRDFLGFDAGDSNLYRYVRNDATGKRDPLGLVNLSYDVVDKITPGVDGGIKIYSSKWKLDEGSPNGGYIIQWVDFFWDVENANSNVSPNSYFVGLFMAGNFDTRWYPYLEAWHVTKGNKVTDISLKYQDKRKWDDSIDAPGFSDQTRPATKGTLVITLKAKYYDCFTLPGDYKVRDKPPAGELPVKLSVKKEGLPEGGSNEIVRKFAAQWDSIKNGFGKATEVKDDSEKPPF